MFFNKLFLLKRSNSKKIQDLIKKEFRLKFENC